jgi:hypothetical protein
LPAGPTVRSVGPVRSLRANGRSAAGGPLAFTLTGVLLQAIAAAPQDATMAQVVEDRPELRDWRASRHLCQPAMRCLPSFGAASGLITIV